MSDNAQQFRAKAEAMLAKVRAQHHAIAKVWVLRILTEIVYESRGPENQKPSDTEYIAKGRLVAGWKWTTTPAPDSVSRYDGGPYDDLGRGPMVIGRLVAQIRQEPLPPRASFWNEVAYTYLVHEGRGRHATPDRWVNRAILPAKLAFELKEATAEVMSRAW